MGTPIFLLTLIFCIRRVINSGLSIARLSTDATEEHEEKAQASLYLSHQENIF